MKSRFAIYLIPAMFAWSCAEQSGNKQTEGALSETVQTETHNDAHQHDTDAQPQLELIDGKKIAINAEMKPHLENSRNILKAYLESGGQDYKKLAEDMESSNSKLIKSCTMQGADHEMLHVWLHPHLELVANLKSENSPEKAKELIREIEDSYKEFDLFFE